MPNNYGTSRVILTFTLDIYLATTIDINKTIGNMINK